MPPAVGCRGGCELALLVAPAIAMLFTREADWGPEDFGAFAVMPLLGCGAYEALDRAATGRTYRIAAALAVGAAFLMVWADLSVGYVGDAPSPTSAGVVLVAVVGACIARLRPAGTAIAMVAIAQLLAAPACFIHEASFESPLALV